MQNFKDRYSLYFDPTRKGKMYESAVLQATKVSKINLISLWNNFLIFTLKLCQINNNAVWSHIPEAYIWAKLKHFNVQLMQKVSSPAVVGGAVVSNFKFYYISPFCCTDHSFPFLMQPQIVHNLSFTLKCH